MFYLAVSLIYSCDECLVTYTIHELHAIIISSARTKLMIILWRKLEILTSSPLLSHMILLHYRTIRYYLKEGKDAHVCSYVCLSVCNV